MSRSYKGVRPKKNRVYSVSGVQDLYDVHRNTVSNWVGTGLLPADGSGPQLFRGAELVRFHADRLARTRLNLRIGEFKCASCKAAGFPDLSTLMTGDKKGGTIALGRCPDCGAAVTKILGKTERNMIQNCIDSKTSLSQIDEGTGVVRAGIGKIQGKHAQEWHGANDQIIFEWQIYAEKYDTKTVDSYLVAIREFEHVTDGKAFTSIKVVDAGAYRQTLIDRLKIPRADSGLSKSTARHRASHVSNFFDWLCNQDGYRRLNKSLPDYFELPKATAAKALPRPEKAFPTIDEVIEMAENMPVMSRLDRRNRAIFAFAFVTGFRASALASLRIRHVDVVNKRATQDAMDVPAKNGVSYVADWFPRTEPLQCIALSWIEELLSIGLQPDDALFPTVSVLATPDAQRRKSSTPIEPMKTPLAVTEAFRSASFNFTLDYTPHSARHCLAALGDLLCRTAEQRKAWSKNLGHSSVVVTQVHYAKVTEARKREIFEGFDANDILTNDEKDLMLDYYDHRIHPEAPEYQKARALAAMRAQTN